MSTLPQDVRDDYHKIGDNVEPINGVFTILKDYSKSEGSLLYRDENLTLHSISDATKHDFNITQNERNLLSVMREPTHLQNIIHEDYKDEILSILKSDKTEKQKYDSFIETQDFIFVSIVEAKKTTNDISREELKALNQKNLSYSIALLILSSNIIRKYNFDEDIKLNLNALTKEVSEKLQKRSLNIECILSHLRAQIMNYIKFYNKSLSESELLSQLGFKGGILDNAKNKNVTMQDDAIKEYILEAVGETAVKSSYNDRRMTRSFSTYADAAGTIPRSTDVDESRLLFGMEKTLTVIIAYHIFSVSEEEITFIKHNVFETNKMFIQISIVPASEGGYQLSLSMNGTKVIIPEVIYDLRQPWTKQKICGFFHYYLLMETYEGDNTELQILQPMFKYMGIRQGNELPGPHMFQNRSNIGTIILCKATMIISGFLGIPYTHGDPKKGGDAACLLQAMEKILCYPEHTIAINTIDRPLFALIYGLIKYDRKLGRNSKWGKRMIVAYVYASSIKHIFGNLSGQNNYYTLVDMSKTSKTKQDPEKKFLNDVNKFVNDSGWLSPEEKSENIIWITDINALEVNRSRRRPRRSSRSITKKHILDNLSTDKKSIAPRILKLFNMLFKSSYMNDTKELIIDQTVMAEIYGDKNKIYSFDPSQEWKMLRFLYKDQNLLDIILKYIQDKKVQKYLKDNGVSKEVVDTILSMLE